MNFNSIKTISIGIGFAIIYLAFPTHVHCPDGSYQAFQLENFPIAHLPHPHHLLPLVLFKVIYNILHGLFPFLGALTFLQALNAILGGISVAIFAQIINKIHNDSYISIITSLSLGFTAGMLRYCTDSILYVPLFFLMLVIFLLIIKEDILSYKTAILATILIIVASLMHQISIFFTFVILAAIIIKSPSNRKYQIAGVCIALYSCVSILVYYLVYLIAPKAIGSGTELGFINWITAYGHIPELWNMFDKGFIHAQFQYCYSLIAFFVNTYGARFNVFAVLHVFIFLTMAFETVMLFHERKTDVKLCQIKIMLLIWFFAYYIFTLLYAAHETYHKIFFIAPLLAMWSLRIYKSTERVKKIGNIIILTLLIVMAVWNITTLLIPNSRMDADPTLKPTLEMKQFLKEGDLAIFTSDEIGYSANVRYYTSADSSFFIADSRYFPTDHEELSLIHDETMEFLTKRYKRIILSRAAFESDVENWYLQSHAFTPPRPNLLAIVKSNLLEPELQKELIVLVVDIPVK